MEVVIAAVGRPRAGGLREAIQDYEERAARYFRLRVEEIPAADLPEAAADRARRREGERLLARIPEDSEAVALARAGKGLTSEGLAAYLGKLAAFGRPGVTFLIGGAFGLDAAVLERSRRHLSLSPMTLPHEVARLVLAEQLYRAGTILRGKPYHKGPR